MNSKIRKCGFTLIELVIGIVVLAIAMMVMNTMLMSQSKDALEPLYHLRASQLGQAITQDLLSQDYDAVVEVNPTVFEPAVTSANLLAQYRNYARKIRVEEVSVSSATVKRIDVIIKTPSDEEIVFSVLKGRY